jgi:hypothetical protein
MLLDPEADMEEWEQEVFAPNLTTAALPALWGKPYMLLQN